MTGNIDEEEYAHILRKAENRNVKDENKKLVQENQEKMAIMTVSCQSSSICASFNNLLQNQSVCP